MLGVVGGGRWVLNEPSLPDPRPTRRHVPALLALRPRDAAKALGISERLLWQLTREGAIPSVKVGRCTLYPVAILEKWLADEAAKAVCR